jgi:hypothetical protein
MSLTSAIDSLVALVDGYSAVPLRRQPPFDAKQFVILDRDVYVEAVGLGLTDHLPRATYVNNTATFGHTNFPGSKGTMLDPPGTFQAMPSQIPRWRDQMLTLRVLAEARQRKTEDPPPAGSSEKSPLASTPRNEEFANLSPKQRSLVRALQGKDYVPIEDVKKAVYRTTDATTSCLERLKTRTNEKLVGHDPPYEIKRKSNSYLLAPLRPDISIAHSE